MLPPGADRKSTRLNSSHYSISYAVFCLKKKEHPPHGCRPGGSVIVGVIAPQARSVLFDSRFVSQRLLAVAPVASRCKLVFFFLNDRGTTEIYPLPLHAALPF